MPQLALNLQPCSWCGHKACPTATQTEALDGQLGSTGSVEASTPVEPDADGSTAVAVSAIVSGPQVGASRTQGSALQYWLAYFVGSNIRPSAATRPARQ